ncbi:MAG TPA: hypothetical protein VEW11_07605 [Gaiellaceae bacterium]|nr:hypothetical protein [Gaiellaceae bacterium]
MRPPAAVLAAFGASAEPEPLPGGMETSWRCGDLVVKPLDLSVEEVRWQGSLLERLESDGFRVPRLRGVNDGWCAWEYLAGEHRARAWTEVIAVGERFHAAIADVSRPSFLDRRTNHWAIGERVAWGELPAEQFAHVKHVPRLVAALRPLAVTRSQLVHGDLTGNVLFADELPPAVIDFSPFWRPTGFASAVVVGDALLWEGADAGLLKAVDHVDGFPQLLLRALIFRAVVDARFRAGEPWRSDEDDCFLAPVELACSLAV